MSQKMTVERLREINDWAMEHEVPKEKITCPECKCEREYYVWCKPSQLKQPHISEIKCGECGYEWVNGFNDGGTKE